MGYRATYIIKANPDYGKVAHSKLLFFPAVRDGSGNVVWQGENAALDRTRAVRLAEDKIEALEREAQDHE